MKISALVLVFFLFGFKSIGQDQTTWKASLSNLMVTYITSENTLSSDYTSKTQAFLCANGYFYMTVIDNYSKAEFEGYWSVPNAPLNQPTVLTVQFTDGDIVNYQLVFKQNKLYVDGDEFQYAATSECQ